MIDRLKSSDKLNFYECCFKNKYLSESKDIIKLFKNIIKNNIVCYVIREDSLSGFLIYHGEQLYILAKNTKDLESLMRVYFWNHNKKSVLKIKYTPEVNRIMRKYKFRLSKRSSDFNVYEYFPIKKEYKK